MRKWMFPQELKGMKELMTPYNSCSKKSPRDPGRICKNMNIDCESRDSKNTIKQLRCKVLFKLVSKQHHRQNPRSEANSPLRNAHLFVFPFCKTIKIFSFERTSGARLYQAHQRLVHQQLESSSKRVFKTRLIIDKEVFTY